MENFSNAFVRLLFKDRIFLASVIDGVNFGRKIENTGREANQRAIRQTLQTGTVMIETINMAFRNGEISYAEFAKRIEDHLASLRTLATLSQIEQPIPSLVKTPTNQTITFEVDLPTCGVRMRMDEVICQLQQCVTDISKGESPTLDLSRIQNLLSQLTGTNFTIPKGKFAGYMVGKAASETARVSGEEIIISTTTTEDELRRIGADNLREIDRQLSSLPNASEYQEVRSRIRRLLAKN